MKDKFPISHLPSYLIASRLGLTLIELMIVIGIIAMLAGIIWAAMAPVREKARQTVCISNLTQIGHAYRMYRDDWGGIESEKGRQLEYWQLGLPPGKFPMPFPPWGDPLASYLKSERVWFCPSWFLPPWREREITYLVNYCSHMDVEIRDPYLPYYEYDECLLYPSIIRSFKWIVAYVPDWPIVICDNHHYFYDPRAEWLDMWVFSVNLPDFSVRRSWFSEYLIHLPRYTRVKRR